eukprot:s282_g30.t1
MAANQGKIECARKDLQKLLQLDPNHKEARAALAKLAGNRSSQASDAPGSTGSTGPTGPTGPTPNPRTAAEACGPFANGGPSPVAWSRGLNPSQRHEWLVDCYRMRLDDDYAWGGCNLHGLYDPDHSPISVMQDFLIFCKLAVLRGAVPEPWDWQAFLQHAVGLLPFAFEKSDAQEKWGSENVFNAMMMGGRSLRFTGELIYGTGVMQQFETDPEHQRLEDHVFQSAPRQPSSRCFQQAAELFTEVGGHEGWLRLLQALASKLQSHFPGVDFGGTSLSHWGGAAEGQASNSRKPRKKRGKNR